MRDPPQGFAVPGCRQIGRSVRRTECGVEQLDIRSSVQQKRDLRASKVYSIRLERPDLCALRDAAGEDGKKVTEVGAGVDNIALSSVLRDELYRTRFPDISLQDSLSDWAVDRRIGNAIAAELIIGDHAREHSVIIVLGVRATRDLFHWQE
jgi:hypothetical protein